MIIAVMLQNISLMGTINQECEKFAGGPVPAEYLTIINEVAETLGVNNVQLEVRIPTEEVCHINPRFYTIAFIPGSYYVFINPDWFDSLSREGQRFAIGMLMQCVAYDAKKLIIGLFATQVVAGILSGIGVIKSGLFKDNNILLCFTSGIVGALVALLTKSVIVNRVNRNIFKKLLCATVRRLGVYDGAIEYYKKYQEALMPYLEYNPEIAQEINEIREAQAIVEGMCPVGA